MKKFKEFKPLIKLLSEDKCKLIIASAIIFLSGPLGGINLNGENITDYELSEDASPIYTFTMPAMDSVLSTMTADDFNAMMAEAVKIQPVGD